MGIRPEHVLLASSCDAGTIKANIDVSEMMGSETYLHANAEGKDIIIRIPTTELPEEYRHEAGHMKEMFFSFQASQVHLFDIKTEENIL